MKNLARNNDISYFGGGFNLVCPHVYQYKVFEDSEPIFLYNSSYVDSKFNLIDFLVLNHQRINYVFTHEWNYSLSSDDYSRKSNVMNYIKEQKFVKKFEKYNLYNPDCVSFFAHAESDSYFFIRMMHTIGYLKFAAFFDIDKIMKYIDSIPKNVFLNHEQYDNIIHFFPMNIVGIQNIVGEQKPFAAKFIIYDGLYKLNRENIKDAIFTWINQIAQIDKIENISKVD